MFEHIISIVLVCFAVAMYSLMVFGAGYVMGKSADNKKKLRLMEDENEQNN